MRWFAALLLSTGAFAGESIEWVQTLDDARAQSKESGRPVLAYFTFNT